MFRGKIIVKLTCPKSLSILILIAVLFNVAISQADDLQVGEFFINNGQIVHLQNNLPLVVAYDDGATRKISTQDNLKRVSDYSVLTPKVEKSIERVLQRVKNKIQELEKNLKDEFDDTYLEMSTACLMADAGYSNSKIAGILTEDRTFSLEEISNTCKDYNYYEDLKVVFEQCKFYEAFLTFANDEISRKIREAEREIRWQETNASLEDDNIAENTKKIDTQRTIIQQSQKDASHLGPIKDIIDNAKAAAENLDSQYYRVYNKTNDTFLTYSKFYNKLINQLNLKEQLPIIDTLIDGWTEKFLQESTLNAVTNAELTQKELYRRRNPAPALKANINITSANTNWDKNLDIIISVQNTGNKNAKNVNIKLLASADLRYGNKDDYTIEVWRNQSIRINNSWSQNPCSIKLPLKPYNSYLPENGNVYFIVIVQPVEGEVDISDNKAADKIKIKFIIRKRVRKWFKNLFS